MKRFFSVLLTIILIFTLFTGAVSADASTVKTYSKKAAGNTALSENFKVKEFACNDGSDTILIDTELVKILQNIRNHFGKPVTINSAYRTAKYNFAVGGASSSYHTKGMAADITVSGVNPQEVARYAETIGVRGIGMYYSSKNGKFVHVDTRPTKYYWTNTGNGNVTVITHGGKYNSMPYNSSAPNKAEQPNNSASSVVVVTPVLTIPKVNVTQYPVNITQGNSFGLRGTISSENNITSVNGYIVSSSGTTVVSTTDTPNSKTMDIRQANLNQKMTFGILPSGQYLLRIVAKDSSGGSTKWESYFKVASKGNASAGISNPNQNIQKGQRGQAVKELQQSLNALMNAGLAVDGIFGDGTLNAVKKFQSKYGLSADGIAGPKTNAKINSLLK